MDYAIAVHRFLCPVQIRTRASNRSIAAGFQPPGFRQGVPAETIGRRLRQNDRPSRPSTGKYGKSLEEAAAAFPLPPVRFTDLSLGRTEAGSVLARRLSRSRFRETAESLNSSRDAPAGAPFFYVPLRRSSRGGGPK